VIDHTQLRELGLSSTGIGRRVQAGRLHAGVLSHASAAAALEIRRSSSRTVDVTVGLGGRARRPGIRLHRSRSLPPDEVTQLNGLPITTPARTLLDLAASGLRERPLEAALDQALQRVLDFADLERLLARYPTRAGSTFPQSAVSAVQARRHTERAGGARARAVRRSWSAATARQLRD
jgi:hypothetical protein